MNEKKKKLSAEEVDELLDQALKSITDPIRDLIEEKGKDLLDYNEEDAADLAKAISSLGIPKLFSFTAKNYKDEHQQDDSKNNYYGMPILPPMQPVDMSERPKYTQLTTPAQIEKFFDTARSWGYEPLPPADVSKRLCTHLIGNGHAIKKEEDGKYKCSICGEVFSEEEFKEFDICYKLFNLNIKMLEGLEIGDNDFVKINREDPDNLTAESSDITDELDKCVGLLVECPSDFATKDLTKIFPDHTLYVAYCSCNMCGRMCKSSLKKLVIVPDFHSFNGGTMFTKRILKMIPEGKKVWILNKTDELVLLREE